MKIPVYCCLFLISTRLYSQTIQVPSGTPLTVEGHLNLPTGNSLQVGGQTYLKSPADGSQNTYLGFQAGNTGTGSQNTFVGFQAGSQNTTGVNNAFFGIGAGRVNTTGSSNVFIGILAGQGNQTGNQNLFLGAEAGKANQAGSANTFLGNGSGQANQGGSYNAFIGHNSGFNNTNGAYNAFIGVAAGASNTSGQYNLFLGNNSGFGNKTGWYNTFLGNAAGYKNDGGNYNTFIGHNAGYNNTSAENGIFIGADAGTANTTGSNNIMVGKSAGAGNTGGQLNVYIGQQAGSENTSGSDNVAIGREAGKKNQGSYNTFLGRAASVANNQLNITNATAIGANAVVAQSNSVILGNGASVGIGTSAPQARLHVVAEEVNQSGIRLGNLNVNSPASVTSQTKFLTLDEEGNVILGSTNGSTSGRQAADEALGLWQPVGQHLQNTNDGGVVIGAGTIATPAGYNLFVSKGILTERVKVAIKTTDDWSDKVFDPSYRLRSLPEVAGFIQRNQHLPGLPSATEVVKEGVDVGQMTAKLLEKVEELTLYVIEQDKAIKRLRRENQGLKTRLKKVEKPSNR